MPIPVEFASLRRRLSSLLYESLLLLGVLAAGFLVPLIALGLAFGIEVAGWLEWLHVLVLFGVYFIWLWRRNGQTLAMQTWQLQLIDTRSGRAPTLHQCLLRYLLAWPSTLLSLTGIGLVWAAFVDRDRQFIHDRLSRTAIIFNPQAKQEPD